jgi:hypothetical protein
MGAPYPDSRWLWVPVPSAAGGPPWSAEPLHASAAFCGSDSASHQVALAAPRSSWLLVRPHSRVAARTTDHPPLRRCLLTSKPPARVEGAAHREWALVARACCVSRGSLSRRVLADEGRVAHCRVLRARPEFTSNATDVTASGVDDAVAGRDGWSPRAAHASRLLLVGA